MRESVRLTREAIENHGNNVLVFPQGTRSKRLSRGHTGLAQLAQLLGADIVPVGCNGSDRIYPSNSPFAKGGRVVYRIGAPLSPQGPELSPYRIEEPFEPFTDETTERHGQVLRKITDVVMNRINGLLDPEYQFGEGLDSDGVQGMDRFV
jgi:1-acyl-sn-glycerol-3-phosphate acyltransferase